MEGYEYDAGSDVDGIFPEEFRKYVRDRNLCCHYTNDIGSFWVFRNKPEYDRVDSADRVVRDMLARLITSFLYVPEQCLVQFWKAEELTSVDGFGERPFCLTTHNQPFMLARRYKDETPFSEGICSYRMKMVDIITGDEGGGVIGRVFRNKRMECTPNIGYYSYEEHPHRDLALSCHIKSSLAIPQSDSSALSVGVLEIVSLVESNLVTWSCFGTRIVPNIVNYVEYSDCCKDICEQYVSEDNSLEKVISEIKEVMQLVGRSSCLVRARTWTLCNCCSYLSTSERLDSYYLSASYEEKCFEHEKCFLEEEYLCTLKKGEGVVGKAATSSQNLVYCDDVSQFSITEYPLAHFAHHHKRTACFATCLRSTHTGNQIYVLEFFLNPSKVNGRGPRAMLVPVLKGMRKNFRALKFASGEEIGDNLSVQVIDARFPDKFKILEIGRLDSIENHLLELNSIHNGENVVNIIEGGNVATASMDKQHNSFQISGYKRGGELAVDVADAVFLQKPVHIDGLAFANGENMGINIDEQGVAIASLEKQHNNATIFSDERGGELAMGVINSDVSLQTLVEENVVHTEDNVAGSSKECIISWEELEKVYGMKREDAAKRLKVSVSTFKRICRFYKIPRWPTRKKNLDQSHSGNPAQTSATKEPGGSVPTVQNESLVTIKAKYEDNFIKFQHSASSGINGFNQQVSKRLKLEAGSYVVKYQDDDNDWILVACDDDMRDYISSSASLGKTTLTMLLQHI